MLRAHTVRRVIKKIGEHQYFSVDDFELLNIDSEEGSVLQLTYRFCRKFHFRAIVTDRMITVRAALGLENSERAVDCYAVPGSLEHEATFTVGGANGLLEAISGWLKNLQEELVAEPVNRQLNRHREEIESLLQQAESLPDEYFTRAEAEELRQRLEELEAQLIVNIEQSTSGGEQQTKIQEIERDFMQLQSQVETLSKRGWFGSLLIRFAKWSSDPENAKVLKGGVNVAKALLPPDAVGTE